MVPTRLMVGFGVLLAALLVSGVSMQPMATRAADENASAVSSQKWDCLVNKTGKDLLVTLASGHAGGGYYVAKDQKLPFPVQESTKKMAYVAFEYGTNNLVRMEAFPVLHQPYPPTNCLWITGTKEAERHKGEAEGKAGPPAAPPAY